MGPELKTIYIYPTPETFDKLLFRDKSENCFAFNEVQLNCPTDESKINQIPIQT
jgi:hypothetical protein